MKDSLKPPFASPLFFFLFKKVEYLSRMLGNIYIVCYIYTHPKSDKSLSFFPFLALLPRVPRRGCSGAKNGIKVFPCLGQVFFFPSAVL